MAFDDYGRGREFGNRGGRDYSVPGSEFSGGDYYGRGHMGREGGRGGWNEPYYGRNEPYYGRNEPYYGRNEPYYGRDEPYFGRGEFRNQPWWESEYRGLGNYPGYGGYSWSPYGAAGESPAYGARDRGYGSELGRGELGRGGHAGRGPRGYQRSDERIEEDVNEQLTRHPGIDATEIEVKVDHGEVTLTGTVNERHAKRMAEDIAESVSGVKDVHNRIHVSGTISHGAEREVERPTEREGRTGERAKSTTRSGTGASAT